MILPDNEPKPSSREARGFGFPAEVNDFHSLFPFPFFKFLPHYIPPFGFHGALVTPYADTESWVGGAHFLTKWSVRRLKRPWSALPLQPWGCHILLQEGRATGRFGRSQLICCPSSVEVTTTTCKMFAKMLTRSPRRKAYCRFDGF